MDAIASVSSRRDVLARLHALEWRYDGPLPTGAVATLDVDSAALVRRADIADSALIDRLARDAVAALAAARRDGRPAAALAACRAAGVALRDRLDFA